MPNSDRVARLEPNEREWAAAICSGAPPFARLQDPAFCVESNPTGAETARRWIDAICNRSPSLEAALFEVTGFDSSNLVYAFGNARLASNERLPVWAECLVDTIRALPERRTDSSPDDDSTEAAVGAFLGAAIQLLHWASLTVRFRSLSSQV